MNISEAFSFHFQDKDWFRKLGIGGLIGLFGNFLILPLFLLLGYQVEVVRRVMRGDKEVLPDWDDWGELFMDGVKMFGGLILYSLPLIVVAFTLFSIIFVPLLMAERGQAIIDEDALGALFGGTFSIMWCLMMVYSVLLSTITPAIYTQYARTGDMRDCYRLGEILRMTRDGLGDAILVFVSRIAAGLLFQFALFLSVITICGPFVLMLVGIVWNMTVTAHLYGQFAARYGGMIEGGASEWG